MDRPDRAVPPVAVLAPLAPGLTAAGTRALRLVATLALGVAALAAWAGVPPTAVLAACLAVPLALVTGAGADLLPLRGRLTTVLGGLGLGVLLTLAVSRLLAPGASALGVLPWAPPSVRDALVLLAVAPVAVGLLALLASAVGARHGSVAAAPTPGEGCAATRALGALAGSGYAAGEGLVRFGSLVGGGGASGSDPAPWVLLVVVLAVTAAVYGAAVALAVGPAGRRPRVGGILAGAVAWGGYTAAAYALAFVGGQPLGLLLVAVVGWFVAGALGLALGARSADVAATVEPGAAGSVAGRRAFALAGGALLVAVVAGMVLGARTPTVVTPPQLVAPDKPAAVDRAAGTDLGDGVRLVVPDGWTTGQPAGGRLSLAHSSGLRARVEVVRRPADAVPQCEAGVRETARLFATSRAWSCRQGAIVGKVDTAAGALTGRYAGPLGSASVTELVGIGHRFEGLSVQVSVLLPAGAEPDETQRQAAQALYAAALTALDAA